MRSQATRLAIAAAAILFAAPTFAAITGTKHDFRAAGGGFPIAGITDICSSCHVPHRPLMNVPLWSHTLTAGTYNLYNTNATYSAGNGAAYDASPQAFNGSKTRACLSCHDGTVAVAGSTFIVNTSPNWILWNNGAATAAGNASGLLGSHPVGVNYVTVQTAEPTAFTAPGSLDPTVTLENSRVQCTTCHNAHMPVAGTRMLVKDNTNSALCLVCHIK